MSSYLLLAFSRITMKDNHLYLQYRNSEDRTLGLLTHQFGAFHNTHLQDAIRTALSTLSGSELKVWRIYSKLQIILNWTHMPHVYGQPSIQHLSRVQWMQEKMTPPHPPPPPPRHYATEKPWWQFFSGIIFCGRREVHFKLIYDLWKVLETCFTAPRSMVWTTPL